MGAKDSRQFARGIERAVCLWDKEMGGKKEIKMEFSENRGQSQNKAKMLQTNRLFNISGDCVQRTLSDG